MRATGICCGASTISIVEVERKGKVEKIVDVVSQAHDGNPKQVVADLLFDRKLDPCDRVASTGRNDRHEHTTQRRAT